MGFMKVNSTCAIFDFGVFDAKVIKKQDIELMNFI